MRMNGRFRSVTATLLLAAIMTITAIGCSKDNKPEEAASAPPSSQTEGAAGEKKGATKKVTLLLPFKSATLDPHNDYASTRGGVTETLFKLNENMELTGWLASKGEAKDELTWELQIREGVTFHDGSKLDAAAVKASLERAVEVSKTMATNLKLDTMVADGQILTIKTTEPHPALLYDLVSPYSSIIQVEAEKSKGREVFNQAPVGTGAFQVKQFTPNVEVALVRYDGYWGGKANLDEAVVKFNEDANVRALALQSKEADIVYNIPAESVDVINKNDALRVESIASLRVHYLQFNYGKPQMQDQKVRQALDLLVDGETVARDVMLGNGTAANGPFNNKLPFGSDAPVRQLNVEKAKELLKEAGYSEGAGGKLAKDGKTFSLELITYKGRPELPLIAQLFQSDAAKAGITVTITTVENPDSYLKENTNWDLATYSNLTAPRGDGSYFLNSAFVPGGALNVGKIDVPAVTEKVKVLNATTDPSKRIELTKQAVNLIQEQVFQSYVVYPNLVVGLNERVLNWKPGREEFYILTHTMDVK